MNTKIRYYLLAPQALSSMVLLRLMILGIFRRSSFSFLRLALFLLTVLLATQAIWGRKKTILIIIICLSILISFLFIGVFALSFQKEFLNEIHYSDLIFWKLILVRMDILIPAIGFACAAIGARLRI